MKYKKLLTSFFKKPLFAQIILLLALVGAIYVSKLSFDFSNNNTPGLATLVLNLETGKRVFEGEVVKNMTILDALSAAVSVGKIKIDYAIDKNGNVNVIELDNHINGAGNKHLVFYLNSGKIATGDLNKKMVHNGDRIEIRNE